MKDSIKFNWQQDYPQMPSSFHRALVQEIEKQTGSAGGKVTSIQTRRPATGRSRRHTMRWTVVAAAVALCGMSAYAASRFHLPELFGWRMASQEAENLVQTEPEITQPETLHISAAVVEQGIEEEVASRPAIADSSPLLDIQETIFDGVMLYVYAVPTENGLNYDVNADRLYINDKEIGPVNTCHYYPGDFVAGSTAGEEMYTFDVDLSSMELTDSFEVTLPLSVYERSENVNIALSEQEMASYQAPVRYQNQDLTFLVDVTQTAVQSRDQSFDYDEFTLEISDVARAATITKMTFYYHITGEQMELYQASQESLNIPVLLDGEGEECGILSASVKDMDDGVLITAAYRGLPEETSECTVVSKVINRFHEERTVAESTLQMD